MIHSLVDIIIPCQNSVGDLRTTLNSIASQTKIKDTRVIIMDKDSTDGTSQYSSQYALDYRKNLKIECISIKDNVFPLSENELKSYLIWIPPGTILNSPDSILKIVNEIKKGVDFYIYKRKEINPFSKIFDVINLRRGKLKIEFLVCKKEDHFFVEYFKGENKRDFRILKDPRTAKIRIFRENIFSSKKIKNPNFS